MKRIIDDNIANEYELFECNPEWTKFVSSINRIKGKSSHNRLSIPTKLKLAVSFIDPNTAITTKPEVELDFTNPDPKIYSMFINIIEDAEERFKQLTRTDIPYFIFIDELEAFYGDEKQFLRDLKMIRDLIITVKYINYLMLKLTTSTRTKIICSVRTEIINAINRRIVTKELNKTTSGFECPLVWNYTNTNSYRHSVIQILLRRIAMSCASKGICYKNEHQEYNEWFPEKIHDIEPANYILNNSWHKPRDIVRLIGAAKTCLENNRFAFTQAVFDSCFKKYSTESLNEIKEEMRALYTSDQIEDIMQCFNGYNAVFSYDELKERVQKYFPDSILNFKARTVLEDLYRLGLIGNYSPSLKKYRWQHKGDYGIVFTGSWKLMIHRALQSVLTASSTKEDNENEREYFKTLENQSLIGTTHSVVVKCAFPFGLKVEFEYDYIKYLGFIHISMIKKYFVKDIYSVANVGDTFIAKIMQYDESHNNYIMSIKDV